MDVYVYNYICSHKLVIFIVLKYTSYYMLVCVTLFVKFAYIKVHLYSIKLFIKRV